mgnify:CR=1 FL=1
MSLRDSVLSAFDEVLDKMAFLFLDEAEDEDTEHPPFSHVVRINFHGKVSGSLILHLTQDSAEQIARNLLGLSDEEPLPDDMLIDAVKEFTNMLTGRSMTLQDPDSRIDLDIPTLMPLSNEQAPGGSVEQITGMLEEQPVLIRVTYDT